jgi:hypothetical protein
MKRLALGLAALVAVVGIAVAAGQFPGYPIVGGASYCGGFSTGTTGQVCTVTVPAGPSVVTGNEHIPADTGLPSGQQPQTVVLGMASLNALPLTVATVVSAATTTLTSTNTTGGYILKSTGTMTSVTINLPPAPIDGQQFALSGNFGVTTLAMAATSPATVSNSPTAMTVSTTASYGYRFAYSAANTIWYRLQ